MHNGRQFMCRAAIAALAGWPLASRAMAANPADEGRQAAALLRAEFVDATGGLHRLSELTRPLLLVDLWAAWCSGCIEELPTIDRLARQLGPESIDVVLIRHEMNWQDDTVFARKNRLPFRFWRLSPHSAVLTEAAFGMESDRFGLPQSLVFAGRARTLVQSELGSQDWCAPPQLRRVRAWLAAAS
ncbi:MAG TPA: TlpA disulfide reductase family protein [Acetobacteraceae bacterium]|nr:TlpA disulfide reductase family protein [Acetobacteraceae bacterium]